MFYATGTNDKALLNSTWEMSANEVERANHTEFMVTSESLICSAISYLGGYETVQKRIECPEDEIYLFGTKADVMYMFFDNKLFRYELSIPVFGYPEVSKILKHMETRFGAKYSENVAVNTGNEYAQNYKREWHTKKEKANFNLYFPRDSKFEDNDYVFESNKAMDSARVFISVVYLPMMKKIEKAVEKEESSYF